MDSILNKYLHFFLNNLNKISKVSFVKFKDEKNQFYKMPKKMLHVMFRTKYN